MREIKFRAWDKVAKEMYTWGEIKHHPGWRLFPQDGYEAWIIMQFTGLRDKNGKEIYEGDVLKDVQGDLREIKYGENGFWCSYPDGGEYLPGMQCREIMGNIYENPELLNGNT